MIKAICVLMCSVSIMLYPSDQLKSVSFQKITQWHEVVKFKGAIVAYHASSYYLMDDAYSLNDELGCYYGYIEKTSEYVDRKRWDIGEGCSMKRLLKKDAVPSACALADSLIKEGNLAMRFATVQEKRAIYEALKANRAEFDYMFFNEGEIYSALGYQKADQ